MHLSAAKNTSFSRSLLAGIVCGILAAILNIAYTVFYRKATDFTAYKVVEPLLIFIAFPLLFVIAGFIFFEMVENIRKGRLYFTILSLVMMAIALIFGLRPLEEGNWRSFVWYNINNGPFGFSFTSFSCNSSKDLHGQRGAFGKYRLLILR